jgi:hypothetical protein
MRVVEVEWSRAPSLVSEVALSGAHKTVTVCLGISTTATGSPSNSYSTPMPGKFLGIVVGQDPSDSKSNRLHVDIFRLCFRSLKVYSIASFDMIGKSPKVLKFNQLFPNSTASSATLPGEFLGTIVCQDPSDSKPTGYMLTSSGFTLFI